MKDSSKAKAANERITEAFAKMLEEADEERKTKRAKTEGGADAAGLAGRRGERG
jgi:hypothetical protein